MFRVWGLGFNYGNTANYPGLHIQGFGVWGFGVCWNRVLGHFVIELTRN